MTQIFLKSQEQRFLQSGINWQQFKSIQSGFAASPGVRLSYYRGEVELLSVSPEHEIFSNLIGILLALYFARNHIEFFPTGAMTQEKEDQVSAQADQSYCFGQLKSIPDLSIEVVFTSGGASKLHRYQALGVTEVWFWEDGVFTLHHLQESGYEQVDCSLLLPNLDMKLLSECLLMASPTSAILEWECGISH